MKDTQQNTKLIGAIAVALSAMLWGVDGILLTPQLYNLNTAFVVFVIHLFPFLLMNVFFFREYRHLKTMTRSDLIYFLLIALFGGALGTLAIVKSLFLLHFNSLSVVVLLQKLQPVFAVILARIIWISCSGRWAWTIQALWKCGVTVNSRNRACSRRRRKSISA